MAKKKMVKKTAKKKAARKKAAPRKRRQAAAPDPPVAHAAESGEAIGIAHLICEYSHKPNWQDFFHRWLEIRPHSTGLIDLPLWAVWAEAAHTADHPRQHTGPPRGRVWD